MPEENQEPQEMVSETPLEENVKEEKRRIKPVIEEVSSSLPAMDENKEDKEEKEEEKKEEANNEHPESMEEKNEEKDEVTKEASKSQESDKPEAKSDIKLFVVIAVVTAIVVAALAGGIYVYLTGTQKAVVGPTATPASEVMVEPTTEPSPSGSPSASLKLSDYKVQILNGSGKIGEAGSAKTLIEKDGFKVSNTGNAATFDFTDTVVQVKSNVPDDVLTTLKKSLSSVYSVKDGDSLSSTSTYDIVITVGSK